MRIAAPAGVRTVERPAATERSSTVAPRQILPALVAVAVLLAGCGGGDTHAGAPAKSSANAVTIDDFKFAPASLTVKSGPRSPSPTTTAPRTPPPPTTARASTPGRWTRGASKTVSVSKAGSYAYHCNIHPFMKGTIVVR